MSESTIPTPADVAAKVTGSPAEATETTHEAPAQETDWKSLARKWESRAKANADAAAKLADLEEASKTEEQKRAEEFAALQSKVSEYERREQVSTWKQQVSEETGVPVAVLAGESLEALQAHAEALKPLIEQKPARLQPIPGEGQAAALPLNGDGIESSLRAALGMN